jgi:ATP-dependent helicase YprA (DUF1998 family)
MQIKKCSRDENCVSWCGKIRRDMIENIKLDRIGATSIVDNIMAEKEIEKNKKIQKLMNKFRLILTCITKFILFKIVF